MKKIFLNLIALSFIASPCLADNKARLSKAFVEQIEKALERVGVTEAEEQVLTDFKDKKYKNVISNWSQIPKSKINFLYKSVLSYSLYEQKLYQAFLEEWIEAADLMKVKTDLTEEMDLFVAKEWEPLLLSKGLVLTEALDKKINLMAAKDGFDSFKILKAWKGIYNPKSTTETLNLISAKSPLKKHLIRRAFYENVKTQNWEAVEELFASTAKDPLYLARYYFERADYRKAKNMYESIPKSNEDYLTSREELAWTYFHLKDYTALMGLNIHNEKEYVPFQYQLETKVLSAMFDLNQCQYAAAQNEIVKFQNFLVEFDKNYKWKPQGFWSVFHQTIKNNITKEKTLAQDLGYIGKYADDAAQANKLFSEIEKNENHKIQARVKEALLKMRFVKIELLSQMKALDKMRLSQSYLGSVRLASNTDQMNWEKLESENMVFAAQPKEVWSDEIFQMKSLSANQCGKILTHAKKNK